MKWVVQTILTLLILVSAGCGDATLVFSTGNGVIVYTTYSAPSKSQSGQVN